MPVLRLRECGRVSRRDDRLVLAHADRGVLPRQIQTRRANPEQVVAWINRASKEIHVNGATRFAAAGKIGPVESEADNSLADRRAIRRRIGSQTGCLRILRAPVAPSVVKGVEQQHAGERYREALRRADFGLVQFRGPALLNRDTLVCRRRRIIRLVRTSRRFHLIAQLADFVQQFLVFIFQFVEALDDRLHVRAGLRRRWTRHRDCQQAEAKRFRQHMSCSSFFRTAEGE